MSQLSGKVMDSASTLCLPGENSAEKQVGYSHLTPDRKFMITEDLNRQKVIFMESELLVFLFTFITQLNSLTHEGGK